MTILISHPDCLLHRVNPGHPESPDRLKAVLALLEQDVFKGITRKTARHAGKDDLLLAHTQEHIDQTFSVIPADGFNFLDQDTILSPKSGDAALCAAGAVLDALDSVMAKETTNVFCAVRPPGHHAHRNKGGGFCLFNNIAIGAEAALKKYHLSRIAIVDFDVHHGDGTQDIAWDDPRILYISTHQSPLFPFTGSADEQGTSSNIVNVPLQPHSGGNTAINVYKDVILPRLDAFQPDLIFVSAGFDAHEQDPLGQLEWTEKDYAAIMAMLLDCADRHCQGRLIAVLEGGYDLEALSSSVGACLKVMMQREHKS